MVTVVQGADLITVPRFVVHTIRLATHVVLHTGRCHQVALVCGINEYLS
jgi:hypothetical protein